MSHHRNRLFLSASLPAQIKSHPAKAMTKAAIPPPKPSTLPANRYTYEKVDKAAVKQAKEKIYAARATELKKLWDGIIKSQHSKTSYIDAKKLNDTAWYPAAKDMSVRPAIFHMTQPNSDLDLGYKSPLVPRERVSLAYVITMAEVGQRRGFTVHVQHHDKNGLDRKHNYFDRKVTYLQAHDKINGPWIEDGCSFVPAGVTIPPCLLVSGIQSEDDKFENDMLFGKIQREILLKEINRFYGQQNLTGQEPIDELKTKFAFTTSYCIARTSLSQYQNEIHEVIHRALASQRNIRANLTYIDGGNLFIGVLKNGQRFALVGRNSVEFSRALLQEQLQELYSDPSIRLSDDMMRYFIAIDLGIPLPNNVAFVEQLDYHLDCAMMLLDGEVLLNDSREARMLELKWNRERGNPVKYNTDQLRHAIQEADQKSWLEEKALRDIQQQLPGLPVHRAALCFKNEFKRMNFANGEAFIDIHGQQTFITNGGIPEAELYIRILMHKYGVEVEFAPFNESRCSLNEGGGLGCRAKCEEKVELLSALPLSPRTAGRSSLPNQRHNLFSSAKKKDSSNGTIATAKRFMSAI